MFQYKCENRSVADKTEVLQSSLSRLNSGDNVIILVNVIYFSWIFNFIDLVFLTNPILYFCVTADD